MIMMADALRAKDEPVSDGEETDAYGNVTRKIETKEEIENYINSLM